MSLFGSLATGKKRIAKDIDFLVVIEDVSCIDELALCHRKVLGKYHSSPDTFVFTKDKKFLGNICHRKECKARSIDCQVSGCGKIKYIRRYPNFNIKLDDILKSKPKLLYLNPKYKIESNDKNRY